VTIPLRTDRILGDRPFAEVGEPVLAVADESRGLLAVAGTYERGLTRFGSAPVGVYDVGDLGCRALIRSIYQVQAMAFHPVLPLLAVGGGRYDGGYYFEGELLLADLETGTSVSLAEGPLGPQVLALEWLTGQDLRVVSAPLNDWQDEAAWAEGHVAVVRRPDWRLVPPGSISWRELAGPRIAAPRIDNREDARRMVSSLSGDWDPRRNVRAVEELSDGRILATLDGVQAESWLPSGGRQWTVADDKGGRDIVVTAGERSAWVGLVRPTWEKPPPAMVRLSLRDGAQLEHLDLSAPASLVRCADGRPAFAPAEGFGAFDLRVRRGSRIYFREVDGSGEWRPRPRAAWLAAAGLPAADRPHELAEHDSRRLFPYSWMPGDTHFGGPGAETTDGSLVYAGTVYDGDGLQPGGSFVVRRDMDTGEPRWVFRTDRPATAVDADAQTAYVAYDDGEIVALDLHDGTVRWRGHLTVAAVPAIPTALTVAAPDRLHIGTGDGRILTCSAG
jgi:hypothetical protein